MGCIFPNQTPNQSNIPNTQINHIHHRLYIPNQNPNQRNIPNTQIMYISDPCNESQILKKKLYISIHTMNHKFFISIYTWITNSSKKKEKKGSKAAGRLSRLPPPLLPGRCRATLRQPARPPPPAVHTGRDKKEKR